MRWSKRISLTPWVEHKIAHKYYSENISMRALSKELECSTRLISTIVKKYKAEFISREECRKKIEIINKAKSKTTPIEPSTVWMEFELPV